jgi:small subunit ribosomal protein S8
MIKDILIDSIFRIKNGYSFGFDSVLLIQSQKVMKFLDLLYLEGFIRGYILLKKEKKIKVLLKYAFSEKAVLRQIIIISKPGRKIFISSKSLWLLDIMRGSGCFFFNNI